MKITVRWASYKYAELTIKEDNTTITTGLLDQKERQEIIDNLKDVIQELEKE